jgi:single-stranded-DNA-specific exonuclease
MEKRWRVQDLINDEFRTKFPSENKIILQLLYNRNLQDEQSIKDFLTPSYDQQILDPFLFADMEKSATRILSAAESGEKVMIYGDYDADGVCSSAVLHFAFKALGIDPGIKIPFREGEGYGLNMEAAQKIIDDGYTLVVTVDCGISNKDEVALFAKHGVDVIVTDHHQEPLELPDKAYAMINPSLKSSGYPFRKLCGAGVAFKLVQGIMKVQEQEKYEKPLPVAFDKWLLDIVAIATVGDIMPLIGENRIFVKYGLMVLNKTRRVGIAKMIEKINNFSGTIDTTYIGWRLVPRINAAGRINHASLAFNLVISENESESEVFLKELEEENTKRQSITTRIMKEAEEMVDKLEDDTKMLWAHGEDWNPGVVGLVAGRISNRAQLPVIVASKKGDKYVGSGRSIDEFDITDGLSQCKEYLHRFGGHPQACGFTVLGDDNFKKFQEKLTGIANKALKEADLRPVLDIDAEIGLEDIDWKLWNELDKFEPFGEANPMPLFLVKNLKIEEIKGVGKEGKHLRAMVSQENHPVIHKIIGFSFGDWCAKVNIGDKIDVVFEIGINEWNGRKDLQLKVVDLKLSDIKNE